MKAHVEISLTRFRSLYMAKILSIYIIHIFYIYKGLNLPDLIEFAQVFFFERDTCKCHIRSVNDAVRIFRFF